MARAVAGEASSRRTVPREDLPFEYMLNALRLAAGFGLDDFERATGLQADTVASTLASLAGRGLLRVSGSHVQPTALGFDFLNDLQSAFLPEARGSSASNNPLSQLEGGVGEGSP